MRFVALVLFAALFASAALAAPIPKQRTKEWEDDKAKLQGKWKVESWERGGQSVLAGAGAAQQIDIDMELEFSGDTLTTTVKTGKTVQAFTVAVVYDADRRIRKINPQSTDKPNGGPKEPLLGYSLDGDKLLIASNGAGQATNPLKPGPDDTVVTLTRVKK